MGAPVCPSPLSPATVCLWPIRVQTGTNSRRILTLSSKTVAPMLWWSLKVSFVCVMRSFCFFSWNHCSSSPGGINLPSVGNKINQFSTLSVQVRRLSFKKQAYTTNFPFFGIYQQYYENKINTLQHHLKGNICLLSLRSAGQEFKSPRKSLCKQTELTIQANMCSCQIEWEECAPSSQHVHQHVACYISLNAAVCMNEKSLNKPRRLRGVSLKYSFIVGEATDELTSGGTCAKEVS